MQELGDVSTSARTLPKHSRKCHHLTVTKLGIFHFDPNMLAGTKKLRYPKDRKREMSGSLNTKEENEHDF
jgi:hypothetical protein